jgi:hypothetical protein
MMLDMDLTTAPTLDRPASGPGAASRPAAGLALAWLDDLAGDTAAGLAGALGGGLVGGLVEVAAEHRPGYDASGPDEDPIPSAAVVTREQQLTTAVAAIVAAGGRSRQTAGELAALADTLTAMDRLAAHAVGLARQLDGRKAAAEEGMTVDGALRLHTRAAGQDVATVLTAADRLATMPATAQLFQRGILSWGHVRGLIAGTRRFNAETRTALDTYLGANADRLARLDTDRLSWAIDDAIEDHRPLRNVERQAERRGLVDTFSLQGQLDGTGESHGQFTPETFAELTALIQAEADAPHATPCPSTGDSDLPDQPALTRSQQHAAALLRLLRARSGNGGGKGAPVRFTVIIDVDRLTDTAAGHILTGIKGRPPRVVRRAVERLSCDAALDVVLRDGTDLLAAKRYTPEVTAATRRAVIARDQGCRFPACTAPATWCDIHHVTPRAAGDDHAISNLVLLCRRHHTLVHRRGWHQTLHEDGTYQLRRRGRTWTTLPRRDQQLPPPGRHGPHGGPAPPDGGPAPPGGPPPPTAVAGRPHDLPF